MEPALDNLFENEAIEKFLRRMKQKLSANQNRGPMVVNDSMRYINLLDCLEQNLRELRENLFVQNPNWRSTVNAAVDVANFAAIIAANAWRDEELNRLEEDTNVDRT